MDDSKISDFIEKRSLVKSLLPHIAEAIIEEKLITNDLDVELTVDQLLSNDTDVFPEGNHGIDEEFIKDIESLDITNDIVSEKTTYWINLFPQLSYDQIRNVVNQNLHEPEEVIFSALEATGVVISEESNINTPESNSKDMQLINDIILFEHSPQDIIENDLLLGEFEDIGEEAITKMKISIVKEFILMNTKNIEQKLDEHMYHIGRTIISIILKNQNEYSEFKTPISKNKLKGIVQRSNMHSNVKLINPFEQNPKISYSELNKVVNVNLKSEKLIDYYNDKTTKLLVDTIVSYYKGNEAKTLKLIEFFEQNEYIDETVKLLEIFEKDNKLNSLTFVGPRSVHEGQKPKVLKHTYKESIKKPRKLKQVHGNKRKNRNPQIDMDHAAIIEKVPSVIDLHGQTVASALMTISKTVKGWWHMELSLRGNSATQAQQARSLKALYAGPLKIITGKGLHSKHGISIIKIQCRNYLRLNFYTFEEEDGFFLVTGREAHMYK